ncbi:uncharacterized protein [Patagioenas fasciata]|uniref:uncharacterized protein isoform X4 n=1 Tax=Patagioenas fasciata TaxID=372321 RepID=UPI003A9962DF
MDQPPWRQSKDFLWVSDWHSKGLPEVWLKPLFHFACLWKSSAWEIMIQRRLLTLVDSANVSDRCSSPKISEEESEEPVCSLCITLARNAAVQPLSWELDYLLVS